MSGLTWLHLSDWHQKGKEFERRKVRDALMEDIKKRTVISSDLEKIDFIVFSGDVAYHGVTEEYQTAITEFFTPLLEAAGVGKGRLFIVPGNHDLEWAALELLPSDLLQRLNAPDKVNERLTDERSRHMLLEPMATYTKFVTDYLGKDATGPEPAYGYVRRFEVGDKKIAVIGLNSAWLSARNRDAQGKVNDRGYLILGEPQVYDALARSEDAEVRIAILHHPFDWLVEFDQHLVEERLGRQCHFILRGHQHLPQVNVLRGTAGDCIVIPAGASYDRATIDPRYVNAYNFVHLDFENFAGTVYLRRWSARREEWIADTDSWDRGQFPFSLPKRGKEVPLIAPPIVTSALPVSDDSLIVSKLQEWKTVHTEMQSLLDKLATVVAWLNRCQIEPPHQLARNLYDAEESWVQCTPALKAIPHIFASFEYIQKESVLRRIVWHTDEIVTIHRQIAEAKTLDDVKSIHRSIGDIKQDIEAALRFADHQIATLVGKLARKS